MSLSRRALFLGRWAEEVPVPPPPPPKPAPSPALVHWVEAEERAVAALPAGRRVAKVQTFSCLNQLGTFCSTCVERCPVPGALRVDGRRVVVESSACDGCGVCAEACPAPGGAILMVPFRSNE